MFHVHIHKFCFSRSLAQPVLYCFCYNIVICTLLNCVLHIYSVCVCNYYSCDELKKEDVIPAGVLSLTCPSEHTNYLK